MKYKLFGKTGLRVAEICLGAMTFGEEWGTGANKQDSKKIFDAYIKAGGNFIDTANRYTEGTSERFLSEFMGLDRDRFVIASKYSLYDRRDDINAAGNHRKNLVRSVEGTLKRLNTNYLDVLWLHAWDGTTTPEEVMRGLDDVIRAGKVHYIAVSDTPAWVVATCNTLAELRGWSSFAGLQIEYSLVQRTPERDLIPMAKHFGMAIVPWSPLGAGILTGKYNNQLPQQSRLTEKSAKLNEKNLTIARKVSEIASKLGVTATQVALNWLRQQHTQVIPVVGARNIDQLNDSLGCLSFTLPADVMQELQQISAIDLGFPHDFLASPGVQDVMFADFKGNLINHRKLS